MQNQKPNELQVVSDYHAPRGTVQENLDKYKLSKKACSTIGIYKNVILNKSCLKQTVCDRQTDGGGGGGGGAGRHI